MHGYDDKSLMQCQEKVNLKAVHFVRYAFVKKRPIKIVCLATSPVRAWKGGERDCCACLHERKARLLCEQSLWMHERQRIITSPLLLRALNKSFFPLNSHSFLCFWHFCRERRRVQFYDGSALSAGARISAQMRMWTWSLPTGHGAAAAEQKKLLHQPS